MSECLKSSTSNEVMKSIPLRISLNLNFLATCGGLLVWLSWEGEASALAWPESNSDLRVKTMQRRYHAFSKRVFVFVSIGFRFCMGHPLVCASVRVRQACINDRINGQLHLDTVNSTFEMNLLLVLIGHCTRCLWSLRHRPINWKRWCWHNWVWCNTQTTGAVLIVALIHGFWEQN